MWVTAGLGLLCAWDLALRGEELRYQSAERIEAALAAAGVEAGFAERQVRPGEPTGDFVRVGRGADGRIAILFGDVEGHGAGPAPTVLLLHAMLDAFPWESRLGPKTTASELLLAIDAQVPERSRSVTMSLVLLDPRTGDVQLTSASVPPARLVAPDGTVERLSGNGHFIGEANPDYGYRHNDTTTFHYRLAPGGYLALLTDGAYDSFTADGRSLRRSVDATLASLVTRSVPPRAAAAGLVDSLTEVIDDATVLLLRLTPR